jgi:UbiD family decarboxylase
MSGLREFIDEQESAGRVTRVTGALDPVGEAGAALARGEAEGRIVVLEQVRGYRTPVIGGLVASRELMAAAVGATPDGAVTRLAAAMDAPAPVRIVDTAPFLDGDAGTTDVGAAVPLLTFQPGSTHPYTTSTVVAARSARHGMNLSFHRMMYLGGNRFSVRIVPRHLRMILEEGSGSAEVAVMVGVHPAVYLAAATSGGPDFDELSLASALLPGGLEVVELDGLQVPAHAELVLRGTISTAEGDIEGPFVDLTGTLDGVRQQPVLTVSRILRREGWLYHTIVPGGREHQLLMGTPQEPRMVRAVSNAVPCLRELTLTDGGCHWLHAVIALRDPLPGQARNAAMAALGAHPSLKRVVVVDDDVDIHDAAAVEWAIATRVQADRDVIVVPGCRGSSLDPSRNPGDSTTAKWIVDATRPPGADVRAFVRAENLPPDGDRAR